MNEADAGLLAINGGEPVRPAPIEAIVRFSDEVRGRVHDLMDSGRLSHYYHGEWARKFEEAFSQYHGRNEKAVACNSGTSALHLALCAAGIREGDEVIVPALCFVAAATAIVQTGAVPIICDAEPGSLTLDVAQAESLISPRTRAIIPVHFWGYPSDVSALKRLCEERGLVLIEDCAQSLGAPASGQMVGTFGDFSTYAFSVRKHISCGEGGMVLCREESGANLVRQLSNYGKGPGWDDYASLGYSYRMAEFPAIIALHGLSRIEKEIAQRQAAGAHYRSLFAGTDLDLVAEPPWGKSVFFKAPVLLPEGRKALRPRLIEAISAENVSCRVPHRPLYRIPWLREYLENRSAYRGAAECPVTEAHHARLFEIEAGPHLPKIEYELTGQAVMKVWRHLTGHA